MAELILHISGWRQMNTAGGSLTKDRLILAITVLPQMNMVHGCLRMVF